MKLLKNLINKRKQTKMRYHEELAEEIKEEIESAKAEHEEAGARLKFIDKDFKKYVKLIKK